MSLTANHPIIADIFTTLKLGGIKKTCHIRRKTWVGLEYA
jgi:hypothetical protein